MRPSGCSLSTVEPGARSDTTDTPGASTSGLGEGPRRLEPENAATPPSVSSAPAVTTHGSRPGEVTVPAPSLPAATTTVMPEAQAISTAAESGSARQPA